VRGRRTAAFSFRRDGAVAAFDATIILFVGGDVAFQWQELSS
jgi:hypothetical protein